MDLFQSEAYKSGRLSKDDIMKSGFGTRQMALVVARIFFNDEDLGVRTFLTPLTNEKATNAKHDNFFDMVGILTAAKKMLVGETLPLDYYSNGDGARWLIAEYVRAIYTEDGQKAGGEQKTKRAPAPYWKLSKIESTKELPGVGKASDIWWPTIGTGKAAKDAIEVVDIYGLIDHSPVEEMMEASAQAVDHLLNPKQKGSQAPANQETRGGAPADQGQRPPASKPTWEELVAMEVEQLVEVGVSFGGDRESLALVGETNLAALRRSISKLCGVTPKPITAQTQQAPADNSDTSDTSDERLPF